MIKNAIVIMFDSLQFNYLGCYGNDWIKTPNMDRFAKEGALFENAYTEGLPTVPCRRAMHTGRFTLPVSGWVPLSMDDTTIADLCWGRPIDTALIFDCPMYRLPKFGYTRGFDKVWFTHGHEADDYFYETDPLIHYDVMDFVEENSVEGYAKRFGKETAQYIFHETANYLKQRQYWRGEKDRYVTRTMTKAIEYLEQVDRNKQFYLWIDSFDPHEPWDPPSVYKYDENGNYDPTMRCPYDPDYTGKDVVLPYSELVEGIYTEPQLNHIRMLYAELVTLCDKQFGRLLEAVRRLGFEENTMMIMVSDHGEPMGNGVHGHGLMRKVRPWPYEELAHIPLIIRAPGIKAGQRIKAFVQSVDIAPTVCDWLGIGVHPDMQGKSLLPVLRGETDKVHDFCIAGYYPYSWAIYTEDWSFVHWIPGGDVDKMAKDFYAAHVNSDHLRAVGGKGMFEEKVQAMKKLSDSQQLEGNKAQEHYKEGVSMDGTAQWTCTPGSSAAVPEKDELYDRKNDPFQQHNVLDKYPDVAQALFDKLRLYISDLKQS